MNKYGESFIESCYNNMVDELLIKPKTVLIDDAAKHDEFNTQRFKDLIDKVVEASDSRETLSNLSKISRSMERELPANLRIWPDEILGIKCNPIDNIDFAKRIIKDLGDTLMGDNDYIGVGLAANQIGYQYRVCIIRYNSPQISLSLINPIIIDRSTETIIMNESCLSLPGISVPVRRNIWVAVNADNLEEPIKIDHVPIARAIQHEMDHLDGITLFDRKVVKNIKIGRNERCPCGSGLKYKKCCLNKEV